MSHGRAAQHPGGPLDVEDFFLYVHDDYSVVWLERKAVIRLNHPESVPPVEQEMSLKKRRFQKGSLQQVRRGKAKRWVVLYYNAAGKRRYHTLRGAGSMTKSQADKERDEFMRTINGCDSPGEGGLRPMLWEFVEQKFLPFQRGKWKKSTAGTSESRIQHHIVKGIGDLAVKDFSLTSLQAFLDRKADDGLSFSMVDHLRWDLSSIFEMAVVEQVIDTNPATRLYTPRHTPKGQTRAMSVDEVKTALAAVELREQVLLHMAIFSGFRLVKCSDCKDAMWQPTPRRSPSSNGSIAA
jgi:hypothetical protein